MKRTYLTIMSLALAMAIRTANAQATVTEQVQVPIPKTPAQVPGPFPGISDGSFSGMVSTWR